MIDIMEIIFFSFFPNGEGKKCALWDDRRLTIMANFTLEPH